ncbi:uncharacterized protein LY89DRAFT_47862 [Mollisia scopiformis]|uniref:Zn(2)-C6 fungal-type domain-containing protein n=1 Tax=Mollisia scopiformis TaxID=149040 RepID=A0A194XF62_MOLSC|nr:uncharacterized protein LY89DRAFT_47862 [Mollisia scopiformis]KUJ18407.1 hypothetical protein LY89DRAFT_47862 [Mollisia scopiformis]
MDINPGKSQECQLCKKTFSQKSSLVRHLKLCTRPRVASLRQKSCRQCSHAKAKCDLQRPTCTRCSSRGVPCNYLTAPTEYGSDHDLCPSQEVQQTSSSSTATPEGTKTTGPEPLEDFLNRVNEPLQLTLEDMPLDVSLPDPLHTNGPTNFFETPHDSTDLIGLGDSWLLAPLNTQDTTPPLAKHSMQVLLRVFRTWPCMLAKGFQYPPIFHNTMITRKDRCCSIPLANCCTLIKMWYGQHGGSTAFVQETIIKEIKHIIATYRTYDEEDLLGALQATTMYIIMLIFPTKDQIAIPTIDTALFSDILQIVWHSASSGLVLQEETDHAVPSWQSWIHITSKRKAVFTLYMVHWSYSVYHGLQSFNCGELGFMPAPAAKFLWEARSEEQWVLLYQKWLAQWDGCEFMHHEFNYVKPGVMLDERTQRWLEDADELGILFSSIFNSTDRGPEFMQHMQSAC